MDSPQRMRRTFDIVLSVTTEFNSNSDEHIYNLDVIEVERHYQNANVFDISKNGKARVFATLVKRPIPCAYKVE